MQMGLIADKARAMAMTVAEPTSDPACMVPR